MSAQGTRDDHWITVYARVVYANYAVALSATGAFIESCAYYPPSHYDAKYRDPLIHGFVRTFGVSGDPETSEDRPKTIYMDKLRHNCAVWRLRVPRCRQLLSRTLRVTSASHFLEIRINNLHNWNHLAVGALFGILVLLGEALLVSRTSLIP